MKFYALIDAGHVRLGPVRMPRVKERLSTIELNGIRGGRVRARKAAFSALHPDALVLTDFPHVWPEGIQGFDVRPGLRLR